MYFRILFALFISFCFTCFSSRIYGQSDAFTGQRHTLNADNEDNDTTEPAPKAIREKKKTCYFFFNMGINYSSPYHSDIRNYFNNEGGSWNGIGAWGEYQFGLDIRVYKNLFVSPKIQFLYQDNNISTTYTNGYSSATFVSKFTNGMFLYGVSAKYYILDNEKFIFYASIGVSENSCIPDDPNSFNYTSDGLSSEYLLGMQWKYTYKRHYRSRKTTEEAKNKIHHKSVGFEVGYSSIPVTNYENEHKNYGGFLLSLVARL